MPLKDLTARKEYKKQQYLKRKLLKNKEPIIEVEIVEPIIEVEIVEPIIEVEIVEPKQSFNLNNFLNETCKNAMNKTEFISSLKLEVSDLEFVGELGYVTGISSLIVRNLKLLNEEERPIHCSDAKRHTFYIKNENKFEKEDESNSGLIKFIKKIAMKNYWLIRKYEILHPDCKQSGSVFADKYNNIIVNSMDEDKKNIQKIIENISNITLIKKH